MGGAQGVQVEGTHLLRRLLVASGTTLGLRQVAGAVEGCSAGPERRGSGQAGVKVVRSELGGGLGGQGGRQGMGGRQG